MRTPDTVTISRDLYDGLRDLVITYAREDVERKNESQQRYLLNVLKDIASLDGSGSLSLSDRIFVVTSARNAVKEVEG